MYPERRGVFMSTPSADCGYDCCQFYRSFEAVIPVFAAMLLLFMPAMADAQPYPAKPLRIVVPFQSGGSVEPIARLVGQKLTGAYGRPVVIENRPGAGGMVGTEYVAKS